MNAEREMENLTAAVVDYQEAMQVAESYQAESSAEGGSVFKSAAYSLRTRKQRRLDASKDSARDSVFRIVEQAFAVEILDRLLKDRTEQRNLQRNARVAGAEHEK